MSTTLKNWLLGVAAVLGGVFYLLLQPSAVKRLEMLASSSENGVYVYDNATELFSFCRAEQGCKIVALPQQQNPELKQNEVKIATKKDANQLEQKSKVEIAKAVTKKEDKTIEIKSPNVSKSKDNNLSKQDSGQEDLGIESTSDKVKALPDTPNHSTRKAYSDKGQSKSAKQSGLKTNDVKPSNAIVSPVQSDEIPEDQIPDNDAEYAEAVPGG